MSCKKGMKSTSDNKLKSVKNKFPTMVRIANALYLKPKPKIYKYLPVALKKRTGMWVWRWMRLKWRPSWTRLSLSLEMGILCHW
jgi:hypothetical protein